MANISSLLNTIKNAVYGRDMRNAIHDSVKAVNDDTETRLSQRGGTMSGEIIMNNYKIKSSGTPSEENDYTNKKYVDEKLDEKADKATTLAGYGIGDAVGVSVSYEDKIDTLVKNGVYHVIDQYSPDTGEAAGSNWTDYYVIVCPRGQSLFSSDTVPAQIRIKGELISTRYKYLTTPPGGKSWSEWVTLANVSDMNTALAEKVDKVAGKGLSANDYTDEEKAKLADLPNSAQYSSAINALETEIEGKVNKEDGKGLSDAASVSVYHANAGNEVLQIVGQGGVTKLTPFYGKQAVDDKVSALSLGLSTKVDKDTTGMHGLSNAKTVTLSDSISEPSVLTVTEQGGAQFSVNFYTAELTDKMLAKLREQSVPHTTASDYPVTLTDALAGESLRGLKVYGGCGKNLFDKDNAAYLIGYFSKTNTAITTHANARTIYIPCEPNTTYTISRNTSYTNFHFGYTTVLPAVGVAVNGYHGDATGSVTSFTLTTGADAKYLVSYIYNGYAAEGTENAWDTIIGGIQIEQGSTATAWEEYKEVGDGGKNLLPYPYYHASRTTNGITCTDNGDGTITASGTATGTAYHYEARITTKNMLCEGGKTYTFSWGGVGSSSTYYGFVRVDDAVKTATATGSVTFTPSTSQYIDVGFLIISGVTVDNLVIKPQIEKGSTATDYEPPRKNLFDKNSDFDAVRQNYPPTITRENNTVVVSAGGGATTKMGAWIIPTNGKTTFTISADSVAFEGSPTVLIREADSFPEYITTVSTFGNAVDTITAREGFTKTVNVSSAYIAIVMQAAGEQKITFDNLRVTTPTYKIPVRVCGKNLFDSEQLLKALGWTCEDGVYSGAVSALFKVFGINTGGYSIPLRGEKLAISFEAKNAAKTTGTTYFQVHYTDGAKQNIGAINSTEWKKYSGVTNAGNISKIIAGYSNDDTVYFRNIQIEAASAVTGYEPYSGSSAVAEVDTPLASGEYIDVPGKKRYASDGTATDITVTGELKTIESGIITIDCTTGVQPPRIEAEYWQDINKVVGNLTSAILANGGNA